MKIVVSNIKMIRLFIETFKFLQFRMFLKLEIGFSSSKSTHFLATFSSEISASAERKASRFFLERREPIPQFPVVG